MDNFSSCEVIHRQVPQEEEEEPFPIRYRLAKSASGQAFHAAFAYHEQSYSLRVERTN
ncbi:hypothetical protein OKW33_005482 [Paraburkholderia atlantica]|uniref:hypothetical protein n=1 Tax=Paraburkholderia atlantica TaxID=2654982 RepID=UPI003D1A0322